MNYLVAAQGSRAKGSRCGQDRRRIGSGWVRSGLDLDVKEATTHISNGFVKRQTIHTL